MGSNESLVEYYGHKAADAGKFQEWREISSSLRSENPKLERSDAAAKAYHQVMGSK